MSVAKYKNLSLQLRTIVNKLIESDDLFKCMLYNTDDALSKSITTQDKLKMIDQKSGLENTRVFYKPYNKNIIQKDKHTEIRIAHQNIVPQNIRYGLNQVVFEIILHNDLWTMDGGLDRPLVMYYEVLNALNEQTLTEDSEDGGTAFILKFSDNDRFVLRYYNEEYIGYNFTMTFMNE